MSRNRIVLTALLLGTLGTGVLLYAAWRVEPGANTIDCVHTGYVFGCSTPVTTLLVLAALVVACTVLFVRGQLRRP